ncbi:MAG: HDOD domain-containing protein [Oceanospirillaceae bacterium]|nr:HDOD domain-containing protein [Oceanospirillaceae bacterium]
MQAPKAFKKQTLMARQPIFNGNIETVAYELLYRADNNNNVAVFDFSGSLATINVLLNAFTSIYQKKQLKRVPAFINLTYDLIVNNTLPKLPTNQIVLEILEDVTVTAELIRSVKSLRKKGYTIALDDFLYDDKFVPLLELAHIIKVDVLNMSFEQVSQQVEKLKRYKLILLAEKIETHEMLEHCQKLGFTLFQGYFLAKPEIIQGQTINASQTQTLAIIQELQKPNANANDIEQLILRDPAFAFKLLRIVNSSAHNLVREINSIVEAINILGIPEVKKWALIIIMTSNQQKSEELVRDLLIRGHMCEQIALASGINNASGYMIAGLISGANALLDIEMNELLSQIPLSREIKTAITEGRGQMGVILHNTINFGRGNWSDISHEFDEGVYNHAYHQSLHWVSDSMGAINA